MININIHLQLELDYFDQVFVTIVDCRAKPVTLRTSSKSTSAKSCRERLGGKAAASRSSLLTLHKAS